MFLRRRMRWAAAACALGVTALACNAGSEEREEATASTSSAVYGANQDVDTLEANVVVKAFCSGTLISPRIVLSANHCFKFDGQEIDVELGPRNTDDRDNPKKKVGSTVYARMNRTHPKGGVGVDLALLLLKEPILEEVRIERPTLIAPRPRGSDDVKGGDYENLGIAGFSVYSKEGPWKPFEGNPLPAWLDPIGQNWRTYFEFGVVRIHHYPGGGDDGQFWTRRASHIGIHRGDSGGPLYQLRTMPDGARVRDVIGVTSTGNGYSFLGLSDSGKCDGDEDCETWTDVTRGRPKAWLLEMVEARRLEASFGIVRTARWEAQHPSRVPGTPRWFGERDYTGACNRVRDPDCDYWFNEHDNCPLIANPEQEDSNDDGVGDACQACPCATSRAEGDTDGDGVCNVVCPGSFDRADNCPYTFNPDQANCNEFSEEKLGHRKLGDVCDPTPCPRTASVTTKDPGYTFSGPELPLIRRGVRTQDRVRVDLIPPSIMEGVNRPFDPRVPLQDVPTEYRFCQHNDIDGYECTAPTVIRREQLDRQEERDPASPWHRVTVRSKRRLRIGNVDLGSLLAPGRGATFRYDYRRGAADEIDWDYRADHDHWLSNNLIPTTTTTFQCGEQDRCLGGRFWAYADSDVGSTPQAASVNGWWVGVHAPDLAGSFTDIEPERFVFEGQGGRGALFKDFLGLARRMLLLKTLPYPAPFAFRGNGEARALVAVAGRGFFELHQDGVLESLEDKVTSGVIASAASSSEFWVSPAESYLGTSRDPLALVVSNDGTRVVDMLTTQGTKLALGRESGRGLPVSSVTPPARTGFASAYSLSARGLFTVGGTSNGRALNEVWFYSLNEGWRRTEVRGATLGTPIAATFGTKDRQLWVLDRVRGLFGVESVRLLRIEPGNGQATVISTWLRLGLYDQQWLTLDADGTVVLTSSSTTLNNFGSARIVSNGASATVSLQQLQPGVLDAAPFVDTLGYGYLVRGPSGSAPKVERLTTFDGAPVNLADLRGLF